MAPDRLFVDSNFFVALFNPHDSLHAEATRLARALDAADQCVLTISNYIFLEVVTVLAQQRGKTVGNRVGEYLRNEPRIRCVHVDEVLHDDAWDLFTHVAHKNVSFVDASTIAVMKNEDITTLLSFDTTDLTRLRRYHAFTFFA